MCPKTHVIDPWYFLSVYDATHRLLTCMLNQVLTDDAGTKVKQGQTENLPKIRCCGTSKAGVAPCGEAAWRVGNTKIDKLLNESLEMMMSTSNSQTWQSSASTDSSAPLIQAHCYHS